MKDLKTVVASVLGIPEDKVHSGLTREDTPEWDSFNHLMLVSEIEKEFDVQIPMAEVEKIHSFEDLSRLILKHE